MFSMIGLGHALEERRFKTDNGYFVELKSVLFLTYFRWLLFSFPLFYVLLLITPMLILLKALNLKSCQLKMACL